MSCKTLLKAILLSTLLSGCSVPKDEEKTPSKTPVTITPAPPAKPFLKRVQLNSGSSFGTTTYGFKTSVSLGNSSTELSGATTHGYRVKYNVQDPNSPR